MANEQRILVLEDSVEDAELIRLEIGRCPFPCEIRVVETKPDFQEALASFRPDLVVSDYSLPGFNGMEALRLLLLILLYGLPSTLGLMRPIQKSSVSFGTN